MEAERIKLTKLEIELERKSLFSKFALIWLSKNEFDPQNEISQDIHAEFKQYLEDEEFEYNLRAEDELERFEKVIKDTEHLDEINSKLAELDLILQKEKQSELVKSMEYIGIALKREIVLAEFGEHARYEFVSLRTDKEIRQAAELILTENYFSFLEMD